MYKTLVKNVAHTNAICINNAIGSIDGLEDQNGLFNESLIYTCENENLQTVNAIKFNSFINHYNISQIDFLKTDCEGGEYDIFNEENFEWIIKNVKKIVGEWHLSDINLKNKFRKFRDSYLNYFNRFEIESMDLIDIKSSL